MWGMYRMLHIENEHFDFEKNSYDFFLSKSRFWYDFKGYALVSHLYQGWKSWKETTLRVGIRAYQGSTLATR